MLIYSDDLKIIWYFFIAVEEVFFLVFDIITEGINESRCKGGRGHNMIVDNSNRNFSSQSSFIQLNLEIQYKYILQVIIIKYSGSHLKWQK